MTDFLHGVETIPLEKGPRQIQQVRSAVIGLVGTAPIHLVPQDQRPPVNRPVLVTSETDAARFGPITEGYTIPSALDAIFKQGAGTVFVVNVFSGEDDNTHYPLPAVAATISEGALSLVSPPEAPTDLKEIVDVAITKNEDGSGLFVLGDDFTWTWDPEAVGDNKLTINVVPGSALAGESSCYVWIYYTKSTGVETITASDIIGTTGLAGRTGMQAWLDAPSLYGFGPKVLIAPGFSSQKQVATALTALTQETKLRAVALADCPVGATRDQVIEARGEAGAIDLTLADQRVIYCYPHLKVGDNLEPYSQFLAGAIAATDAKLGYWHSPSNKKMLGVDGLETPLTAAVNDPNCDVGMLNAAGIVTVFTGYGAGIRTWGNHSSAFPGSNGITTFIPVRRTIDMVDEAIELAALEHIDGPVTDVLVNAILEDVNAFLRTLVNRKALLPGSRVEFFAEDNPSQQLAAGQIVFTKTFCPPPPAERITYKSVLDTTLLRF